MLQLCSSSCQLPLYVGSNFWQQTATRNAIAEYLDCCTCYGRCCLALIFTAVALLLATAVFRSFVAAQAARDPELAHLLGLQPQESSEAASDNTRQQKQQEQPDNTAGSTSTVEHGKPAAAGAAVEQQQGGSSPQPQKGADADIVVHIMAAAESPTAQAAQQVGCQHCSNMWLVIHLSGTNIACCGLQDWVLTEAAAEMQLHSYVINLAALAEQTQLQYQALCRLVCCQHQPQTHAVHALTNAAAVWLCMAP